MGFKFKTGLCVAVLALISACGKDPMKDQTPAPGLEDKMVFQSAVIEEPINDLLEGFRIAIDPSLEAFSSSEARRISKEIRNGCEITQTTKDNEVDGSRENERENDRDRESNDEKIITTIEIKESSSKVDCPIRYVEKQMKRDSTRFGNGPENIKVAVKLSVFSQVRDAQSPVSGPFAATISGTQLKALTVAGRIQLRNSNTDVLQALQIKMAGKLTMNDGKVSNFARNEASEFTKEGTLPVRNQRIGIEVDLRGKPAKVTRIRVIKNGAITSEKVLVNDRELDANEREKLKNGRK